MTRPSFTSLGGFLALLCLVQVAFAQINSYPTDSFSTFYRTDAPAPQPRVSRLYPDFGPRYGRTVITVWGSDFVNAPTLGCGFVEYVTPTSRSPLSAWYQQNGFVTFVSDTQILCLSPSQDAIAASGGTATALGFYNNQYGPNTNLIPLNTVCTSRYYCPTKLVVTNDGTTWSAYPWAHDSGTALDFYWYFYDTLTTSSFALNNFATQYSFDNVTGPAMGGTVITITQTLDLQTAATTMRTSLSLATNIDKPPMLPFDAFAPSQNLQCGWLISTTTPTRLIANTWNPTNPTTSQSIPIFTAGSDSVQAVPGATAFFTSPATWLGYTDSSGTKLQIRCTTPSFVGVTPTATTGTSFAMYWTNDAKSWMLMSDSYAVTPTDTFTVYANDENGFSKNLILLTNQDSQSWVRGPLQGQTEVTFVGKSFLPSNNAKCAFIDPDNGQRSTNAQTTTPCLVNEDCFGYPNYGWMCCNVDGSNKACCAVTDATYLKGTQWDLTANSPPMDSEYRCMTPKHPGVGQTSSNQYPLAPGLAVEVKLSFAANAFGASYNLATNSFRPLLAAAYAKVPQISPTANPAPAAPNTLYGYAEQLTIANSNPTTYYYGTRALPLVTPINGPILLLSDVYVATDGNDATGTGTYFRPYRTIQKAIDMSLYNQREGVKYANGPAGLMYGQPTATVPGASQMYNPDTIVLKAGVYRGYGNKGIRPRGKLLTIRAEQVMGNGPMDTVVDCEGTGEGFLIQSPQQFWDNDDNTDRESIVLFGITPIRCGNQKVYTIYDPSTKSYRPYHSPMRSLSGASYLEPRTWNVRPGRSTPGTAVP